MTSIPETTPPRSIARAITSLAGSTMPVPATLSSYGFVGAAIGGGAVTRGSCLAAMDHPAKLTIAIARSGMPCRVGENARVISSGLRKTSKGRGADSVNTAVLHRSDAVGETVDPGIMRHDDDCPVGSARRILEDLEHGLTGIGIQRSSGLVAHDEPGSVDQRAGDGDALLLTTGELVRQFAEMRAHPDTIEDRGSWRCCPRYRHPGCDQRNGCVLGGGQRRQKIVLLKMKPMLLRRKTTFSASDIRVSGLPHVSTSPVVEPRIPAMIEIRVVLPQPDGPTSIVSSPAGTSRLMPCRTSTAPSPMGKDFVTLRQRTAGSGSLIAFSPGKRSQDPPP